MPDRHAHRPFCFRAEADEDRAWLLAEAERTGQKVNAILARMLAEYRQRKEQEGDQ